MLPQTQMYITRSIKKLLERAARADKRTLIAEIEYLCEQRLAVLDDEASSMRRGENDDGYTPVCQE